jgi:hypothetical protein
LKFFSGDTEPTFDSDKNAKSTNCAAFSYEMAH